MWIKNEAYNQEKKSLDYLYSAPIGFQIFQKHSIPWGRGGGGAKTRLENLFKIYPPIVTS